MRRSFTPDSQKTRLYLGSLNGAKETRTPDPLHAMQVLYQLSYGPMNEVKPVGLSVVVPKLTTATILAKHRLHLTPHGSKLALNLNLICR